MGRAHVLDAHAYQVAGANVGRSLEMNYEITVGSAVADAVCRPGTGFRCPIGLDQDPFHHTQGILAKRSGAFPFHLREPVHPFTDSLRGHELPPPSRGGRALTGAEWKRVNPGEPGVAGDFHRGLEIFLRLPGKAHDDVRGDCGALQRRPHSLDHAKVVRTGVLAVHPPEDLAAAGLQWQVQVWYAIGARRQQLQ